MVKTVLSILLWIPALAVKLVLAAVGLVVVPFTHPFKNPIYGNHEDPIPPAWFVPWTTRLIGKYLPEHEIVWEIRDRLEDYIWRAIRNPVNNVRYLLKEPDDMTGWGTVNPDSWVREGYGNSAWRFVRSGLFSEFWYLRRVGDEFFEFRIGWKFSGVPGFAPTIQLRLGG